jgi:hypothetical protein
MKLNELVCPRCGQKCWVNSAYTTCDRCQTFFYASQQITPWPLPQTNSPFSVRVDIPITETAMQFAARAPEGETP